MGLESVELLMAWEDALGVEIPESAAEQLITVRQAYTYFAKQLSAIDRGPCPSARAFHRIRHAFVWAAGLSRRMVRPAEKVLDLWLMRPHRCSWADLCQAAGIPRLPAPVEFLRPTPAKTVGELVKWAVAYQPRALRNPGEPWTKAEVREVVRACVVEQLGIKEFSDDDEFVKDLGVN